MLRVFIGYDPKEHDAFEVCADSLRRHTSIPIGITAVQQARLRKSGVYTRPADEPAATEFAFTRFLVPFLCDFKGWAMFVDCDFLFTRDVNELGPMIDKSKSVSVVKHDYTPKAKFKMDGQPQVWYPRKNWSSLMIFNCAECTALTPEFVNSASPEALHRFSWTPDAQIGDLPLEWNWLEGEYTWPAHNRPPAGIHFTNGGPWHVNHKSVRFGDLWVHAFNNLGAKL